MKFAILQAVVGIAAAAVFQHAITWRSPKMMETVNRDQFATYVQYRNALRPLSLISTRHRMFDSGYQTYFANITVGTPPQQFSVAVDTGSGLLWIPVNGCNVSSRGKHMFDPKLSSTFVRSNKTWSIEYGTGKAGGFMGKDTVNLGGMTEEQLTVPNSTFGLAQNMSFKYVIGDGILGLGLFDFITGSSSVLTNAINQSLLDRPLFTIWTQQLTRRLTSEGLITYGAIDNKSCGPVIAYEPLTSTSQYKFKISSIGIQNYTHTRRYEVVSDTGASLIGGPKNVTDWLAGSVGAVYNATEGLYTINCNATPPTIDFTIGRTRYSLHYVNYIIKLRDRCYFAISPFDTARFSVEWVFGAPFYRQYCHIFDVGGLRIGFAKPRRN